MRGGVTVRAQDLTRLNRDVFGEIREFHPLLTPKLNNITLRQAIKDYLSDDFYRKRYVLYRYGEIEDWDVSNVKNMKEMFMDASSFNQPLNNWNVSNVRDMTCMFVNLTSFNQPLNNWNVSNVRDMYGMFSNATSFNQPLNNWNVSNVRYMDGMASRVTIAGPTSNATRRVEGQWGGAGGAICEDHFLGMAASRRVKRARFVSTNLG